MEFETYALFMICELAYKHMKQWGNDLRRVDFTSNGYFSEDLMEDDIPRRR